MQIKARAVIIDDKGRVLLQKLAKAGFYCLPGGTFEDGELLKECLVREIEEELGVHAKISGLAHIQDFIRTSAGFKEGSDAGTTVIDAWYFVENWQDFLNFDLSKASHGFESELVEWYSYEELPENLAPKHLPGLIKKWTTEGKKFLDR